MTKADQSRLRILILLVVALGLTVFISSRINRRPNPAVVQAENQKAAAPVVPVQSDARIRLDLLEKDAADRDLGKKNLFSYGAAPAPPTPTPGAMTQAPPPPPESLPGAVRTTPIVQQPPPPPPIPL